MGQDLSCECLAQAFQTVSVPGATKVDVEILHKETKFAKSAFLGLSSSDIWVRLSNDCASLSWRIPKSTFSSEEFGEVSLTNNVSTVKEMGTNGFAVLDSKNAVLFEVKSEDVKVRNEWVSKLNALLQSWKEDPSLKPEVVQNAANFSDKAAYFAKREQEIQENKAIADEKRKKYAAGGMKYTAAIMMERADKK